MRSSMTILVVSAVLAAPFLGMGSAAADTEAPTAQDKRKAKKAFRLGRRLFRRRRYTQAVEAFERAYRFWPRREIQFNIAYSYAKLGEWVKAVTHLRAFLKEAAPAEKRRLPKLLREAQGKVGVLVVRMPDDRAEIFIDGRLAGKGHVEMVVEPGERVVEIRLEDKTVSRKNIDVLAGTEKVWELTEMPQPALPRPVVRPVPRPLVVVRRPRPVPVVEHPKTGKKSLQRLHWAYFVGAAAAALGAGVGVTVLGIKTQKLRKDYEQHPSESLMNEGNRYKLLTNVMIGVTAGLAATAGVLALFTKWKKTSGTERQAHLTPALLPGGGMILVTFHR